MAPSIEALEALLQICHASAAVSTKAVLPHLEAHYEQRMSSTAEPARDVVGLLAEAREWAKPRYNGDCTDVRIIRLADALAKISADLDRERAARVQAEERADCREKARVLEWEGKKAALRERDRAFTELAAMKRERDRWKTDAQAAHYTIPGAEARIIAERDAALARAEAAEKALSESQP